MKNIIFLIVGIIAISCHQQSDSKTVIAGNFANLYVDSIFIVPVGEYFPGKKLLPKAYYHTVADSTGNYRFEIPKLTTGFYQIVNRKYPLLPYDLFVEQGDSLYIKRPAWNSKDHLSIVGKGAEKLNYLNVDGKTYALKDLIYDTIGTNGFASELIFKSYLDSIYTQRLHTLMQDEGAPDWVKSHFEIALIAEKSKLLLEHLERRKYLMNGDYGYFYPDPKYYHFKRELAQTDSNVGNTQLYKLANAILNHRAQLALRDVSEEDQWKATPFWKMAYLKAQSSSIWKDILMIASTNDYSLELALPGFFDSLSTMQEHFNTSYTAIPFHTIANREIEAFLGLAPGEKAPDIALPDAQGKMHRLSDYVGNVLYVDFWGTWCYPCIKEIPDALKLQEKYTNQPVKFVYISMEYSEEEIANWKQFIAGKDERFGNLLDHKPFPGIHLVADKQMRNPQISPYKIRFAPTHVLIDAEGNLVQARADRSNKISTQIDSLLHTMH